MCHAFSSAGCDRTDYYLYRSQSCTVCGLGFSDGLTFNVAGTSITLTGLAIAAIMGVALNAILPEKKAEA